MAGRRSSSDKKPEKSWVTSGEVARALNMTDAAIRRWAREGLLEAIKTPGGQYRFRREAVSNLTKMRSLPKARKKRTRSGTPR
ncbi:MAG: MerR family transcriptional regulator [Candidatus Eremiobacteraeota bacterium]|nr:MerR family transcriptional regulator [Candidatus Eremiobacteraeota bacterium]